MKIFVSRCLESAAIAFVAIAFVAVVVFGCQPKATPPTHEDSMYECKDGKCYPKKNPDLQLGK